MGRLRLDVALGIFAVIFANCVVQSQYFVESPTHIYVVQKDHDHLSPGSESSEVLIEDPQGSMEQQQQLPQSQFMSRRGGSAEDEEEEDDSGEDEEPQPPQKHRRLPQGRPRPVKLPADFEEKLQRKMQIAKRQKRPLHGDPSPIHQNDDEDGRRPESRLLWPFSIEISKGGKGGDGWGPGHYGSHHGGHHGGGHGGHGLQIHHHGHGKGHHNVHVRAGSHHGPHDGWGWDAYIEHEKHKLKYEILKLKAKKKIAVLQNKVELKKLLSMLLQKKIQALEWWR